MGGVEYKDQSASDLRLSLLEGPLDTNQFMILQADTIYVGGVKVETGIIGTSHFVRLDFGDRCFSEVLACTPVRAHQAKSFFYGTLRELRYGEISLAFATRFSYRLQVNVSLDEQNNIRLLSSMEQLVKEAQDLKLRIGLGFEFPIKDSIMVHALYSPQTLIWVNGEEAEVIYIKTAHAYPNERSVVLTETFIGRY